MNISRILLIVGFVFITFTPFLSSCDRRPPEVKELETLQTKSESGDIEAQVSLALKYYKGQGVLEDHATAFRWYFKAAEQGNAEAQYWNSSMYHKGEGVEKDNQEVMRWFLKAVEQGNIKGIVVAVLDSFITLKATGKLPQNVNYAIKSSYIQALLDSVPEASDNLRKPQNKKLPFEKVVDNVKGSIVKIETF